MIKAIKQLRKKYSELAKRSEYVEISQIANDLYHLEMDARLKRVRKEDR